MAKPSCRRRSQQESVFAAGFKVFFDSIDPVLSFMTNERIGVMTDMRWNYQNAAGQLGREHMLSP
jgi:hypothetical protein